MPETEKAQIAHLLRRAGFGATQEELDEFTAMGYDATVRELVYPTPRALDEPDILQRYYLGNLPPDDHRFPGEDLLLRYYPDISRAEGGFVAKWLYRMLNSHDPLKERMALFCHQLFACGGSKAGHPRSNRRQIETFRRVGLTNLRTVLVEVSKDPAMIFWLDNNENHRVEPNENYGRELLELFSMGAGNYTEADVKASTQAFTGWTFDQPLVGTVYGKWPTKFVYHPEDHDDSEKTFLGETGRFNGEDIIDIICRQPATARFVARHLYNFFVADEPPVSAWSQLPPRNIEAIETLSEAYFSHRGEMRPLMHTLFTSDFFKEAMFQKVKSPTDLVAGLARIMGTFKEPEIGIGKHLNAMGSMGQTLMNPLTVEGWITGQGWIDGGTLNERVNYAVNEIADTSVPGTQDLIDRLGTDGESVSLERFVDLCLEHAGLSTVSKETRAGLLSHAHAGGPIKFRSAADRAMSETRVGKMLQLVVSAREYQFY
ncbi:MAG: DUF1800 domain-containing protein [SAR202 cluster bacterium]|nr:DUF1800 domain-containing protein [SAR202 cluster bacterium]